MYSEGVIIVSDSESEQDVVHKHAVVPSATQPSALDDAYRNVIVRQRKDGRPLGWLPQDVFDFYVERYRRRKEVTSQWISYSNHLTRKVKAVSRRNKRLIREMSVLSSHNDQLRSYADQRVGTGMDCSELGLNNYWRDRFNRVRDAYMQVRDSLEPELARYRE